MEVITIDSKVLSVFIQQDSFTDYSRLYKGNGQCLDLYGSNPFKASPEVFCQRTNGYKHFFGSPTIFLSSIFSLPFSFSCQTFESLIARGEKQAEPIVNVLVVEVIFDCNL